MREEGCNASAGGKIHGDSEVPWAGLAGPCRNEWSSKRSLDSLLQGGRHVPGSTPLGLGVKMCQLCLKEQTGLS